MKILFLSELFYPHGGGAELATYLYAKLLTDAGFDVVVVTNRFAGEPELSKSGNLTVYRLSLFERSDNVKYSILWRFDVLLSSFLKTMLNWADVIYIPRFWFAVIPLAKFYKKPVVVHLHDYIPVCPLATLYDQSSVTVCNRKRGPCTPKCIYVFEGTKMRDFRGILASTAINSAFGRSLGRLVGLGDAIICVSRVHRDLIIKRAPSLENKTCVIYNPLPEVSYIEMEGDDFGYFGGPNHPKGFHVLCDAAKHINKSNHGKLNIHATRFLNPSKHLVNSLGILHILPYGKLSYDQFEEVYRQIRAVVVPSVWPEPSPFVVSEALLKGRLVVASHTGGIPEQVVGCPGAFMFRTGDYKQLAEEMLYVEDLSKETTIDLGMKNRERVLAKSSNRKTISEFIRMLTSVSQK